MIFKFFNKAELPPGAATEIMQGFRDFRHALDMEKAEREIDLEVI